MKKDGKKNKEREVACNIHLGNVHYTLAGYLEIEFEFGSSHGTSVPD